MAPLKKPLDTITKDEAILLLDMEEDHSISYLAGLTRPFLEEKAERGSFAKEKAFNPDDTLLGIHRQTGLKVTTADIKRNRSLFHAIDPASFTLVGKVVSDALKETGDISASLTNSQFDQLVANERRKL